MRPNRDFGLITLARNPFADSDEFLSILVGGFHMFATAHIIAMAVCFFWRFRTGKWKSMRVIEAAPTV